MLKKIYINQRTIPVPVPLKNLNEALDWIAATLLKDDQVITKILLDGKELEHFSSVDVNIKKPLDGQSKLEILMESPRDLAIHSLEVFSNLASVIARQLKPIAVKLWEYKGSVDPKDLPAIHTDLSLIVDLIAHFLELTDLEASTLTKMNVLQIELDKLHLSLEGLRVKKEWQALSRVLLNGLEPVIEHLLSESSHIRALLFSAKSSAKSLPSQIVR